MNALSQVPPAIRTTCPYCGVGCGLLATPDGRGGAAISGDPKHPANLGRLCSKGSALGETLGLETRLLHPMRRAGDGALVRTDWNAALDTVAENFKRIIARDGPEAIAFYLSGQLLTEDYYVANKLMKGFIGSPNVDTNSRLCMSSSVAGHRRAFGADTVPGAYEDLDSADLIVLVGSNAAWCHPVLFQRIVANRNNRGARVVVIDPRRTATAEEADLFLPIAPGTDTALFCGLLSQIAERGGSDDGYIARHTRNFSAALARAREIAPDVTATAAATGLPARDVAQFFDWFRETPGTVTCFSQGVNQSAQGTDKVNAIVNCHLAAGRIGRPGMGPFSLTGQPNAMGGREVGGLANQLAAHMGFSAEEIDRVGRFWNAPNMVSGEGHKAVAMFDAIEAGQIKALWVMATNPAVSLPRAGAVRDALRRLEFFVVSENVLSNDTVNAGAHLLLPAAAWGEKSGTVTNSERRISRQRQFLPSPGEARPDWWIVSQVARRMGYADAFAYESPAGIFREHATLSAFENDGTRDFDLGGLTALSDEQFDALDPVQWPVREGERSGTSRLFADGGFFTPDGKAQFIAPDKPALAEAVSNELSFRLNTGRVRDQWHTMTRTGLSARLGTHIAEPFVEIHPRDAAAAGLADGGYARVTTQHGECVLKVVVTDRQRAGSLFAPIHWSDETASGARVGELVSPRTDTYSGQPEAKATPAAITPVLFAAHGFLLSRRALPLPAASLWSRVTLAGGFGYLIATDETADHWRAFAHRVFGADGEFAEYEDAPRGIYRAAAFDNGKIDACLFIAPRELGAQWDTAKAMFDAQVLDEAARRAVLSGRAVEGAASAGPILCACFGVGIGAVREAIASGAATSVEEIGKALRAGTNCGSCLPELKRILSKEAGHARIADPV